MKIRRVWAMPNSNTFDIKPIRELIVNTIAKTFNGTNEFWSDQKKEIGRIVKKDGRVISFSWNSGGIGKKYGFKIEEILIVAHGGWHNDTICVVERKIK